MRITVSDKRADGRTDAGRPRAERPLGADPGGRP